MKRMMFCLMFFLMFFVCGSVYAADVTLGWSASTGANVSGYRLSERAPAGSYDYANPIFDGNVLTTMVTVSDDKHYFVVRAYNSIGVESGDSNEVFLNDSAFDPLSPISFQDVIGGVQINWPSQADAIEYRAYMRQGAGAYSVVWSGPDTTVVIPITVPDEYDFYVTWVRVKCIDSSGTATEESTSLAATHRDYTVPGAPSTLTVNSITP